MATQTMTNTGDTYLPKMKFLRAVLYFDELICAGFGLLFLLAAASIAEFLGIHNSTILFFDGAGAMRFVGLGLLLAAAIVFWVAQEAILNPAKVWLVVALNLGWCIISWLLLLTQALPLTTVGSWAVLLLSDVVLVVALAEIWGLRRLRQ